MVREDEMIMISEDEYEEYGEIQFNEGWSEFKHLVIDYLNQYDKIGYILIEDIQDLC
jgi:hypothetical protein|tara:strand:+ start:582 stop:752 length:171 start_codon:yes stop_codon:yes gene_type:complete